MTEESRFRAEGTGVRVKFRRADGGISVSQGHLRARLEGIISGDWMSMEDKFSAYLSYLVVICFCINDLIIILSVT